VNCSVCRINLEFAQENPAEIERIKQEDSLTGKTEAGEWVKDADKPTLQEKPIQFPVLLLLGSFVFVFCLGEAVHELGHFLVHRAYGVHVGIRLDPFGGSRILHGVTAPQAIWGITSLGGPLFNLLSGIIITRVLWRRRSPELLPLVLWGPVALIQEGVTFSLGMLTPGGDAELMVEWGVPASVLISLGVILLVAGIVMICWLLPLVNLSPSDSFGRKFSVVTGGMVSFMVLRLLASTLRSPDLILENTIPLLFSLLLATAVVVLYRPVYTMLIRISETELASVTRSAATWAIGLGMSMILLQLVILN
jgi:hypothetical protein